MGGFCSGPFPSSEGVGALGTGLVPSTIKGPGEASELQSLGSCASFLPNPFNDGKCFSKDSCHSERGDFPPSQGRMACLLGAQAQWGGGGVREQSQCSEESHDGNQETHMFSFLVALSSPGLSFPI